MSFEEVDQAVKLLRVLGADIGSLAEQVLRVLGTAHIAVDVLVAEAGVDEDGADHLSYTLRRYKKISRKPNVSPIIFNAFGN